MSESLPGHSSGGGAALRACVQALLQGLRRITRPRGDAHCVRMLIQLSADWYWETDAGHRLTRFLPAPAYVEAGWTGLDVRPHEALLDAGQAFRKVPLVISRAAGVCRHALISGEPVFDRRRRFVGYRGVGSDITAYKEAERALNASESQLAAIIDSAMDAVITVDAQRRIVVFNEAAGAMFGCGRAQALGAPLERYVPDALSIAPAGAAEARASKHLPVSARALQLRGLRADGRDFPADASVSRIDLDGQVLYCFVLRDLTERLAAEQARQSLEGQLRQSQKMEALGTLAGGIAHDFNNIVAAILGNAALARANVHQPQLADDFLGEISKAGLRARDLVQRIMAFSRHQPPVFRCQPLQPLIEEGVQLLRAMLPSGIQVVYDSAPEPLFVRADSTQLSQVLMNLGTNAWQALGSAPGRIVVTMRACGTEARVSVTDTGCGMDPATLQRIFEPFFTTKTKGEGTGLGLPVVHGILRSHGGRVEVTSRVGEGSTFDVFLPLTAQAEPGGACEPPPAVRCDIPGRGQHVLYLDDYPAMVFMVKATLEARGYLVSGFSDAGQALAYLREHAADVDVLVTDYNMPGCSGLDLAVEVGRLRPRLPVVLASGLITDDLRRGAAQAGVQHLFDKACGIEEMCALVGRILGGASEAQPEPEPAQGGR